MGREFRMVPADWEHPKNEYGEYAPMHKGSDKAEAKEWWDEEEDGPFEDWEHTYMPEWSKSEATHFQMYENTSEGTPISPPMKTKEDLAKWLADNNASAFVSLTLTEQQWLQKINSQIEWEKQNDK